MYVSHDIRVYIALVKVTEHDLIESRNLVCVVDPGRNRRTNGHVQERGLHLSVVPHEKHQKSGGSGMSEA